LTIFITPGGSSSPRCSFSTLSSKRASSDRLDRLVVLLLQRFDFAIALSSSTPICHHWPGLNSAQSFFGDLRPS
jgi:hypothetical protein